MLTTTSSRCHLSPRRPDRRRIRLAKFPAELFRPCPDRLMGDDNAAHSKQIFDHPKTQWKAKVQPDRMRDDLGGKAMAAIERIMMNLGHAHSSQKFLACPLTLLCRHGKSAIGQKRVRRTTSQSSIRQHKPGTMISSTSLRSAAGRAIAIESNF